MTQHTVSLSGSLAEHGGAAHPAAPAAMPRPIERTLHGDTVVARYRWLRDLRSPEVAAHFAAENAFTDGATAHLAPAAAALAARIAQLPSDPAPTLPVRAGAWWYLDRAGVDGTGSLTRVPHREDLLGPDGIPVLDGEEPLAGEQVLLDDQRDVVGIALSADHRLLARAEAAAEGCTIIVTDIATGAVLDRSLHEVGPDLAFSLDAACLIYTVLDDLGRRHQVRRHALGAPVDEDVLLFEESDHWADLDLTRPRCGAALLIRSISPIASEVWTLDLSSCDGTPRSVTGHHPGQHPLVEHAGDRLLVLRRDRDGRSVLSERPLHPGGAPGEEAELLTAGAGEVFESVEAFASFVALQVRIGALQAVQLIPRRPDGSLDLLGMHGVASEGELTAVHLDANPDWSQTAVRCRLDRFLSPTAIIDVAVTTGASAVLAHPSVEGIDLEQFQELRLWADSADGTQVPISLLKRRDVPLDGTAPGLLYGDGAYGAATDPLFAPETLAVAERGVVVAIAHVRGGGEMGPSWHEQGRLHAKSSSVDDFVACADHLVAGGWVDADRLGSVGSGAGGLLVGAAANRVPERFRAVLAGTPLTDLLETMLDPEVLRTLDEWAEWGDPAGDEAAYRSLKALSPAENVRAAPYPAVYAWTAHRGTDVPAACAAIWVATLRERATSDPAERPILLRCTPTLGGPDDPRLEGVVWLLDQVGAASLGG
ncbi:prolyl oligopeptidase family serine peptidase [Brachybacterium sp. YJGR34]|uniref:prolyl oligopeptidase family serine peptidase n=1 Tax=Brachybacterium sp. YJGR34 TaxID=2059911 RepID=UPI000E0A1DE6|nr:prolyl oligopeptidase family serine peptidase [Brachybacterium sp. YJGR34]